MNIIEKLTPLYNEYKKHVNDYSPHILIGIMWDIGEILENEIAETDVKSHTLFRAIYGKSEGRDNIVQKSYITREFLSRSYRVYKMYKEKSRIIHELKDLDNITLFREAMPFLDNPKYMNKVNRADLLSEICSKKTYKERMDFLGNLKREHINKKNSRTQKLIEVREHAKIFVLFYNYLYGEKEEKVLESFYKSGANLVVLFKNTQALADENFKKSEHIYIDEPKNIWDDYSNILYDLITDANAKNRRRFRKLIPISKIINLSTMIYKLILNQKNHDV